MLVPSVRLYQQGQADFYHVTLDGTDIVPGDEPNPAGPFFSADYRLSKLRSVTYGLKLVWNPTEKLHLDLGWDHYDMKGRDPGTPSSASFAPPRKMTAPPGAMVWAAEGMSM